jgi:hypothetical protein
MHSEEFNFIIIYFCSVSTKYDALNRKKNLRMYILTAREIPRIKAMGVYQLIMSLIR